MAALNHNNFTADQLIDVDVNRFVVILVGEVDREDLVYEAIATAESVSPHLEVFSELVVCCQEINQMETVRAL